MKFHLYPYPYTASFYGQHNILPYTLEQTLEVDMVRHLLSHRKFEILRSRFEQHILAEGILAFSVMLL